MIEIKFIIMALCSFCMMAKFHPAFYLKHRIVKIEGGKIVGEPFASFYAYRGIPYAESPIGNLRFAPPKRYSQTWEGVRSFKNYSDVCAQYNHFGYYYEGSEDCLTVNIYVPNSVVQSYEKVPVVVFIHGGAFMYGSSKEYGPEILMKSQNMILVTVNYRLGILGFLSTEDSTIPGNFGLKDQVEALRWVQRNIIHFNGDREKVTIVGFSAGGASVQLHYMSPLTDGLFNNGISHSGVALNPWVMVENSKEKAHKVANFMNCSEDHASLLTCVRGKPAKDLVMLAKEFQPFLYNPFSPFGVVVEPESDTAFLTDDPKSILEKGNFKRLPWFVSQTQDEGLYPAAEFYNDEILKTINDKWEEVAPFILDFNGTTDDGNRKLKLSSEIRKFYLKDQTITKTSYSNLLQMITDRLYHDGAFKAVQLQSTFAPTYFYYFRFVTNSSIVPELNEVGQRNGSSNPTSDYLGVSHGDDVFLVYFNPGSRGSNVQFSADEKRMGIQLINLYQNFATENFATFGNKTVFNVEPNKVNCLEIFSPRNFSMTTLNEDFGHVNFWDSLNIVE